MFNTGLRTISLLAKFVLILFLAKWLSPDELGRYGLLSVTIIYVLIPLGGEFYTYSTREIIGAQRALWSSLLKNQSAFFACMYLVGLPLIAAIFYTGLLPWSLAGWFFLLLILEHIAQEMTRLLLAMAEQVLAGWVLFFRIGFWAIVVIAAMWRFPSLRGLDSVLIFWAAGSALACCFGAWHISKISGYRSSRRIDWRWVGIGLKVAIPMLLANLALRGVLTVDRYFVESISGLEVLGSYVLYVGVAGALASVLDASVIVYALPRIVSAAKNLDYSLLKMELIHLTKLVLIVIILFSVGSVLVIEPTVSFLDNRIYSENLYIYKWLLSAFCLYSLGLVPHIGLYALKKDIQIISANVTGLVVFLLCVGSTRVTLGVDSVLLGVNLAFLGVLICKVVAFIKELNKFKQTNSIENKKNAGYFNKL